MNFRNLSFVIRHLSFIICHLSFVICLYAGGIATTFTGVDIEGLLINTTYNLTVSHDCPLKIINNSSDRREIIITPKIPQNRVGAGPRLAPASAERVPAQDYEPLPDLNWLVISPERYQLEPNQSGSSDVILIIPKDKKLRGRKFSADLEISGPPTEKKGGVIIVPSLLAKLRFSVKERKKGFFGRLIPW